MAVALVVAYHLGLLRGGFVGVDVFFDPQCADELSAALLDAPGSVAVYT